MSNPFLAVVIDDDEADRDAVVRLMRQALDASGTVAGFASVDAALASRPVGGVAVSRAKLVILDDHLGLERAEHSMQRLRRAGFCGAIVILTGQFGKRRGIGLLRQGAVQLLEKDQLEVATFARLLLQLGLRNAA